MKNEQKIEQLSLKKQKELEQLMSDYSTILQEINGFIEVNNLDYDEVWDKTNQQYDEDLTYAPKDE